jgi:Domain of unknown function (DUF4388)
LAWKTVNDHNKNIAGRLSKLAAAGSTGSIPISGPTVGAIYFRDGEISYAESDRTPKSCRCWPAEPRGVARAQGQLTESEPTIGELASLADLADLADLAEATVDAAADLLSSRSACARFRVGAAPPVSTTWRISVADLLSEVGRRRRLLEQFTGITADTAVARNPQAGFQRVQVSALQWALLIRVQAGSTPRDLAWALGRSVFGTTAEVHRLMTLGLLAAAGANADLAALTAGDSSTRPAVLFMRALPDEKGSRARPDRNRTAPRRQAGA